MFLFCARHPWVRKIVLESTVHAEKEKERPERESHTRLGSGRRPFLSGKMPESGLVRVTERYARVAAPAQLRDC